MRRRAKPRFWLFLIAVTLLVFGASFLVMRARYAQGEALLKQTRADRDALVLQVNALTDQLNFARTDEKIDNFLVRNLVVFKKQLVENFLFEFDGRKRTVVYFQFVQSEELLEERELVRLVIFVFEFNRVKGGINVIDEVDGRVADEVSDEEVVRFVVDIQRSVILLQIAVSLPECVLNINIRCIDLIHHYSYVTK